MEQSDSINIFKHVLIRLVNEEYKYEIQTEFPKKSDFNKKYEDNYSIFNYFPRNSGVYCEILLSLNQISGYNSPGILNYLCRKSNKILTERFPKKFNDFLDARTIGGSRQIFSKEHFLLLLLFTDLILLIIKTHGVPKDPVNLIDLGLVLASGYKEIGINLLLDQWSVIFSLISKEYPSLVFEQIKIKFDNDLSQEGNSKNRIRFLFNLIRYFRLDTPGFKSDEFLDYLRSIMKNVENEKSSVYTSLSTLLITYNGDTKNLEDFYTSAVHDLNWDNDKGKGNNPGALDLVTSLMVIMKQKEISEIKEFCKREIFPHAIDQGMMPTAVRIFRNYIWNFDLDSEWLFVGWYPELSSDYYTHLRKLEKNDNSFFSIFEKYMLPSLYFNDCQKLLSEIIVLLSSIDFKYIRKWFKSLFENYGISDVRIMAMIQTLPKINNPKFCENDKNKKNDIELFIEEFASRLFLEMYPKFDTDYDINPEIKKKYKKLIYNSTECISDINFDFGAQYNEIGIFSKKDVQKEVPFSELMNIMPDVVKGGLSGMKSLTEAFIVLSASRLNKISIPMFQSCELLLQNPKSAYELIPRMIKIVTSPRHDAMICNCLKLLKKALDGPLDEILAYEKDHKKEKENDPEKEKEQNKDTLLHSIEFCAFIGLTSENPYVRITAFKLLIKINKFLSNQGLYSLIDEHRDSIQLNVRNNIFAQEYLKTLKKGKLHEEMFTLETCLRSRFHVPWLFFIAEFCRLIMTYSMSSLWSSIASLAEKFKNDGLKETNIQKSFHQGLLVIFATTAYNSQRINPKLTTLSNYNINQKISVEERDRYYNNVIEIFKKYCSKSSHNIYYAFRQLNYTIIPDLLGIIIEKYNSENEDPTQSVRTLYSMIRTLDEAVGFTSEIFKTLKETLVHINSDLIKNTNNLKKDIENYIPKRERDKQKGNGIKFTTVMKSYKVVLRSFLLIIQTLLSKESIGLFYTYFDDDMYSIMDLIVSLLEKSKNHKIFKFIKKLSADILIDILKQKPLPQSYLVKFKCKKDYLHFLKTISKCELYKKKVLKVILKQNPNFLYYYILSYFRASVEFYSLYFSSIYDVLVKSKDKDNLNTVLYTEILNMEKNKLWGYLFLLALYKIKTGGKRAEALIKQLNYAYSELVHMPKSEDFETDCEKNFAIVPSKYFGERIAELVVRAGQKELRSDHFSRSLKVVTDVLCTFIMQFHFYPNYDTCIPSQSQKKGERLTKAKFLSNMMEITLLKTKGVNGYDKILKLWHAFLRRKSHRNITFSYIFNYKSNDDLNIHSKVTLLTSLMVNYPRHIITRLAKRCQFSFYAYCFYQKGFDFESEFWIVDVLTHAIDMLYDSGNSRLLQKLNKCIPIFIHYAILFHSNQTSKMLIKLCEKCGIQYSKMALSYDALQRLVYNFQKHYINKKMTKATDQWKKEAMRWVVGCTKLKYAHTSLIILNALEKDLNCTDSDSPSRCRRNSLSASSPSAVSPQKAATPSKPMKEKGKIEIDSDDRLFDDNDEKSDVDDTQDWKDYSDSDDDESKSDEEEKAFIYADLLRGAMKSTAYFIKHDMASDKNEVYEFIDDTFLLFNHHFENNEELCLNYLMAFLDVPVPLDEYLPEMSNLYESCFNCEKTSKETRYLLPNFFRPLLHVMESDQDAKKSFEKIVSNLAEKNQKVIDVELVQAVFNRNESRSIEKDKKIVFGADIVDLNRVLGHYASMADNCSPELKKRIFFLSTLILERFQMLKETKNSKKIDSISPTFTNLTQKIDNTMKSTNETASNTNKSANAQYNSTSVTPKIRNKSLIRFGDDNVTKTPAKNPFIKNATQIMSSEFSDTDRNELNFQYVVQIFNTAVSSLPDNKEAIGYILKINQINPLISTISFNEVQNYTSNLQTTIKRLKNYGKQENDTVTLTNCKKISSASNLIELTSNPSILPFTSELSLYEQEKITTKTFDRWALILKCIAGQILKVSTKKKLNQIEFSKLSPVGDFIPDDGVEKPQVFSLLDVDQFKDLD